MRPNRVILNIVWEHESKNESKNESINKNYISLVNYWKTNQKTNIDQFTDFLCKEAIKCARLTTCKDWNDTVDTIDLCKEAMGAFNIHLLINGINAPKHYKAEDLIESNDTLTLVVAVASTSNTTKRSHSSKNQSNKKARRTSSTGQSRFNQPTNEETIADSTVSSNESETSPFPNWLNIPLEVWDVEIIKYLGLKQVAIMRGVNKLFEPCCMRRFTMNLLPLRVPYDIGTLDQAMRVMEILIDRKPYSKKNPLVVEIDKGEHQITSIRKIDKRKSGRKNKYTNTHCFFEYEYANTLIITRSNIRFVGKGKETTTILGGFQVENQNISFKNMTVTNTAERGTGICTKNTTAVELIDVALKGCRSSALLISGFTCETTVVATRCEFANSRIGALVCGSLTSAIFKNCVFNDSRDGGLFVNRGATIHLHGDATAIHSNKRIGIHATESGRVIVSTVLTYGCV